MNSPNARHPQNLSFINQYSLHGHSRYRDAYWLLSNFDSDVWEVLVGTRFLIDWRVVLSDGHLLTSRRHAALARTLKAWTIVQLHPDTTNGRRMEDRVAYQRLRTVLHCIDYLLTRSEPLGLTSHGLLCLTTNELAAMVGCIASSSHVAKSIYRWPEVLGSYLSHKARELSDGDVYSLVRQYPIIAEQAPQHSTSLGLSQATVIRARAWLWTKRLYEPDLQNPSGYSFAYTPKCTTLAREIYCNTLLGSDTHLPRPVDLALRPLSNGTTAKARAPITNTVDSRQDSQRLRKYIAAIETLRYLRAHGFGAPKFDANSLRVTYAACDLKEPGRFIIPPASAITFAIRAAIEFLLKYGDSLVDSYLAVLEQGSRSSRSTRTLRRSFCVLPFLVGSARELGIKEWRAPRGHRNERTGLAEAMCVLQGAILLAVSALTARRGGELTDLVAMNCLSQCETYLRFSNRKSAINGLREVEYRPIPPIAVRGIQLLERCQTGLLSLGVLHSFTYLFRNPSHPEATKPSKQGWCLDAFCDFAQLPCNENGERYYLRPHQLRRFFAQKFFWNAGLGSLESLRFFLGHSDPQQVYRYVTECTPGEVLRSVKVEYAVSQLRTEPESHSNLAALVEEHFGTTSFELVDSTALADYLARLMKNGTLVVEPQFLPGGRYRILLAVRRI